MSLSKVENAHLSKPTITLAKPAPIAITSVSPEDSEEENQIPNVAIVKQKKTKKTTGERKTTIKSTKIKTTTGATPSATSATTVVTAKPTAKKAAGRKAKTNDQNTQHRQSQQSSSTSATASSTFSGGGNRRNVTGSGRRVNYASFFRDEEDDHDAAREEPDDEEDAPSDGEGEWKPSKNVRVGGDENALDFNSTGAFAHLRERSSRGSTPVISNGLPEEKPKYVRKKKYTIEEIYQNKNYLPPKEKLWETIFEKPELEERAVDEEEEEEEEEMATAGKSPSLSPMQEELQEEDVAAGQAMSTTTTPSPSTAKETRTSARRPQPPRTNVTTTTNSAASLIGTRKLKRKADFLATKAKTLKRKQKVKKTEGKYKLPSASRMDTIEEKFRETMRKLADQCERKDEEEMECR